MISEKYKCIFIHIPRTAGQSIENFFLPLHGLTWKTRAPLLLRHNPDPALGPERLTHLTASEYIDCGYLTCDAFDNYFTFSFVRNPWDRLVSEFRYRRYDEKYTFKEFVIRWLPNKDSYSDAYRHIIPQYRFLYDDAGNQLVDFVGRFEKLQSDFDYVCSKLDITNSLLPHVNSSRRNIGIKGKVKSIFSKKTQTRRPYTSYYDEETMEFVQEMYAIDISTFGYKFSD
jgi:hypothetical protein